MSTVHSELGASSYSRWKECPGSIRLSAGIPNISSSYAEEGTRAHEVAAILLGRLQPDRPVEDEMLEAVKVYTDFVESLRAKGPSFEAIEEKVSLDKFYPGLFGTADYIAYFAEDRTLYVVDYKHGAGIAVEVFENEQLLYYGLGALYGKNFPVERIVLVIVQPRCSHPDGPVRAWETTPINMLDFLYELVINAKRTADPNAPLKTGDHCRFCRAQAICPEQNKQSLVLAQQAFSLIAPYDPEKLATTLRLLPQVKAWCSSVTEFAYREAESGRIPPGFKLVEKRATRKWAPGVASETIADLVGIARHEAFDQKLKSPAQIEKLCTKDGKKLLEELIVAESSGKTLVEESDNRAAIAIFEAIEN